MGGHAAAAAAAETAAAAAATAVKTVTASLLGKSEKKVTPRKLLMQRKAAQVEKDASVSLLFHCSGVSCKQWRELKNSLASIHGRVLFQPNYKSISSGEVGHFTSRIASSPGPLCLLYLGEEASQDKFSKLLPPPSLSESMLLLYGQQRSSLINHVDVKKAASLDLVAVYRRGVFSTLFNPMAFFSGLDKLKAAKDSASNGECAPEAADKEPGQGT